MRSKEITIIAINVALLAVLSQITVPLYIVPFTLQMFGIYLISFLFTPKITLYSVLMYLLLGFMGLPIFAQFKSGITVFLSPTIGFLLSFPFVSYFNSKVHSKVNLGLSFLLSSLIVYFFGLSGLHIIFKYIFNTPMPLTQSILSFALVFIPTDFLSYILSYKLSLKLNNSNISL